MTPITSKEVKESAKYLREIMNRREDKIEILKGAFIDCKCHTLVFLQQLELLIQGICKISSHHPPLTYKTTHKKDQKNLGYFLLMQDYNISYLSMTISLPSL